MALDYQITTVRLEPTYDQSHMHVALIGYESLHTPGEPIQIPIERALQKIAQGEKFHVVVGGEPKEVAEAACPVCGHAPYLKTAADSGNDQVLLGLPRT